MKYKSTTFNDLNKRHVKRLLIECGNSKNARVKFSFSITKCENIR